MVRLKFESYIGNSAPLSTKTTRNIWCLEINACFFFIKSTIIFKRERFVVRELAREQNSYLSEIILGLFYISVKSHVCQPFIVLGRKYVVVTVSKVQAEKRLLNCFSADTVRSSCTEVWEEFFKWTLLFSALPLAIAQLYFPVQLQFLKTAWHYWS